MAKNNLSYIRVIASLAKARSGNPAQLSLQRETLTWITTPTTWARDDECGMSANLPHSSSLRGPVRTAAIHEMMNITL